MSIPSSSAVTAASNALGVVDPTIMAGWISGALTAVATVAAVVVAAWFAYRHAREHSQRAQTTAVKVDRLRREINALERIWGLLAYMTLAENASAIVRWRKEEQQDQRVYYVDLKNLRGFVLTELPAAFYTHHAGLHLPTDIRDQLFDYAGSLMGLHLKYENTDASSTEPIVLENRQLIDKLRSTYDNLNSSLKGALEERYQQMLDVE